MHIIDKIVDDISFGYSSNKLSRKDKKTLLKYYKTLLKLDKNINKLELTSKVRADLQNSMNFYIENSLYEGITTTPQEEMEPVMELVKEETSRLKEEIEHIKSSDKYEARLLQSDAVKIMQRYISADKIPVDVLTFYPETKEDLDRGNSLPPGSIVTRNSRIRKI